MWQKSHCGILRYTLESRNDGRAICLQLRLETTRLWRKK
jgi:hypothetical protein